MRTLMVAENLPFPTFKGGDLRDWQNLCALASLGEAGVFGLCSNDRRTVKPDAGIAVWQSSTDRALAFPTAPGSTSPNRRWLLEPDGHPADSYYSQQAARELEELLARFRPDMVLIERLWLHRYIAHVRPYAGRVVLDAHNVEADLARQLLGSQRGDELASHKIREILARRTEAIEARAVCAVDQVWACSEADRGLLERSYQPIAPVHVVPNGVDLRRYGDERPSGRRPAGAPGSHTVVFPAMFGYAPNVAAARFLIDELMPHLRSVDPACRLVLVGGMPTAWMIEAAQADQGIVVTGTVPDMGPFLKQATAVVVPLFEGSGTRFKILEAMAARVPVVTTAVGADGLDVEHGEHLLVAQTASEFAAALRRVRSDHDLAERMTRRAYELVERRYSWASACECIAEALNALGTPEPAR